MSKATPTPAPTAGHEMRRSTGDAYVAMYAPDSRTPIMPSSSSCRGVPVDSPRYIAQRESRRCRSSAQAPPGIGGLGLSRRKHASRLRTQCTLMLEQTLCHPYHTRYMGSQGAAWLVQLPGTKPGFLSK